ncbi:MAG: hypothetical protein MZU91_04905 [Desulfosudis oleivorans]|nr:hypothetical protein [Desulfosudis oleivorans]
MTSQEAYMPNGHYMWILDKNEMASIGMPGLRAAINVYDDGSASGAVFDPDGFVVTYIFLDIFGFPFCSDRRRRLRFLRHAVTQRAWNAVQRRIQAFFTPRTFTGHDVPQALPFRWKKNFSPFLTLSEKIFVDR